MAFAKGLDFDKYIGDMEIKTMMEQVSRPPSTSRPTVGLRSKRDQEELPHTRQPSWWPSLAQSCTFVMTGASRGEIGMMMAVLLCGRS